jgi:DNA repair ATPase RecN
VILLALALALTAAGAACGDDDDGGSGGVSKSEYLTQARSICQKGNRTLTAASNDILAKLPPGQKLPEPEVENFVRATVIPTIRDQVAQLRALTPPKGEKKHVEEIYDELDEGLDELEKDPKKLSDGSNVFADADALAKKYGIDVCSAPTG